MEWNTEKYSFSFDSEMDKDIIRLIESCPKGKRSRLARKVFREYLDSLRRVPIRTEGMKIVGRDKE